MTRPTSVLLAHSYFLAYDAKQVRKMKPYPPLATLLAAAVLKRLGVSVSVRRIAEPVTSILSIGCAWETS